MQYHTSYTSANKEENTLSTHGVGFLIEKDLAPKFKRITDKIVRAKIELSERNVSLIAAYAPTLPVCKANPAIQDDFYESLDAAISKTAERDFLFVLGDFKTGSLHTTPTQMK